MAAAPNPPPDLSRLRIAASEREAAPQPPSKTRLAVAFAVAGGVLAVGLAVWASRGTLGQERASASPVERQDEPAPSSTFSPGRPGEVLAGGRVESSERRELAFARAGVVGAVRVTRGQQVKAADVLVELEASNERADVAEKRAALDAALARLQELTDGAQPEELEQAQRDVEATSALARDADEKDAQAQKLIASGAITRSEQQALAHAAEAARARALSAQARLTLLSRGARKTSLASAQAEVSRVRAALAQAEARLAVTRLTAPIDGTVVEVRVRTGEATGAEAQMPAAVVLTNLQSLEVKVDVPEGKATRVKVGDAAAITVEALSEFKFHGHVKDVGLEADRQKGTIEVTVGFDANNDTATLARLRPRMAARVAITVKE